MDSVSSIAVTNKAYFYTQFCIAFQDGSYSHESWQIRGVSLTTLDAGETAAMSADAAHAGQQMWPKAPFFESADRVFCVPSSIYRAAYSMHGSTSDPSFQYDV